MAHRALKAHIFPEPRAPTDPAAGGKANQIRVLVGELLTDKNRSFERIEHFQDLQPQVRIDLLAVEPLLHHGLRLRAVLALDERAEPRTEEEDLAVLLDVG